MERKSNMKILLRGMRLSGGAPKSAYQYMKLLSKEGHSISVIMQEREQSLRELYEREFDRLTVAPDIVSLFKKRSFISLYRLLSHEYRSLKDEKPDLVFALGYAPAFFYGRFCNELSIPCVMLVAGGDMAANDLFYKNGLWNHTICFSEENRDVLRRYADEESITVISNRIELGTVFKDLSEHYGNVEKDIRILLTSRISEDKYNSVLKFIDSLNTVSNGKGNVILAVAGGGEKLDELKKYVSEIENPFLKIEIKGHTDNLQPEFEKAHIVVGKGRSVLEPVMMNRLGCVIGDDGKIEVCSTENFERLYYYNFSGRQLECDDPVKVLKKLLVEVESGTTDLDEIKAVAQLVKQYYSAEYLKDKLYTVLDTVSCSPRRVEHISIFRQIIRFAIIRVRQKFANIKK